MQTAVSSEAPPKKCEHVNKFFVDVSTMVVERDQKIVFVPKLKEEPMPEQLPN
jgi:hypothetical protein